MISKALALSNKGAYERVYRNFMVQYSEAGGRDKYKSVQGVGVVTEAMYARMKSAGQPSCTADWSDHADLDDEVLKRLQERLTDLSVQATLEELTAAGGTLWGAMPRSGMAHVSDRDTLDGMARLPVRGSVRTTLN